MSESTSEDFSDSDSEVSEKELIKEKASIKVPEKRKNAKSESSDDSDNENGSDDSDDEEVSKKPNPPKKRKTLQDYLIEKVNLNITNFNLN